MIFEEQAQQVPMLDARIKAETLEFASPQGYGKARGYLVRPVNASGPSWARTIALFDRTLRV